LTVIKATDESYIAYGNFTHAALRLVDACVACVQNTTSSNWLILELASVELRALRYAGNRPLNFTFQHFTMLFIKIDYADSFILQ